MAEDTVLTQLAAQCRAVFASSDDYSVLGDRTNLLNVSDSALQPLVTGLGGLTGNPLTGVAVYSASDGGWLTIGGTSASAPL